MLCVASYGHDASVSRRLHVCAACIAQTHTLTLVDAKGQFVGFVHLRALLMYFLDRAAAAPSP